MPVFGRMLCSVLTSAPVITVGFAGSVRVWFGFALLCFSFNILDRWGFQMYEGTILIPSYENTYEYYLDFLNLE